MRFFLYVSAVMLVFSSLSLASPGCAVEHQITWFVYQNGSNPPSKSILEEIAKTAAETALAKGENWIAEVSSTFKKAGFCTSLGSYLSTNHCAFQVGLVCTYRFKHKNKIFSEFKVRRVPRVVPDSTRDWFAITEYDLAITKLKDKQTEIGKELNAELETQCEQHENQ